MLVTGSSEVSNALSNYTISNSLRFQSASSQYATRTPASAGSRTTWTWSGWVKRGTLGSEVVLFGANGTGTVNSNSIRFTTANGITFENYNGAGADYYVQTTAVYRDPSAWYHVVAVWDTTNATASERQILYINGSRITAFSSGNAVPLNATSAVNNNILHYIGGTLYFDGYMAEVNFIDGQALTPASFGATNPYTGQWQAQKYTGTYGTNGFYLPFSNGTSTTTLGADSSGNGNNWTLTNFTRSAGVSDCWMIDVPSGNGTGPATQPSSNYAVLSPIDKGTSMSTSFANLGFSLTGTIVQTIRGTIFPTSGKWYFEATTTANTSSGNFMIGIATNSSNVNGRLGGDANSWGYTPAVTGGSYIWYNNVATSLGITDSVTGTYGCAYDADNGKVWFRRPDGSWISGDPAAGTSPSYSSVAAGCAPSVSFASGASVTVTAQINNGQRSFTYTPPTGFVALCTANLPASTAPIVAGNKYMNATTWTGTGADLNITTVNPCDLVWAKSRSQALDHYLSDSVRGAGISIYSNLTSAESSTPNAIKTFYGNGFQVGSQSAINANGSTSVAWTWTAGQGTNTTNTDGSIASVVSVNRNSGFSIVTYTGNGVNSTIGHGLGIAPKMVIVKNRNNAGLNWRVQHTSLSSGTSYLSLNLTDAQLSSATIFTAFPTATVINVGTDNSVNGSTHLMLAYCFAEIAGFSKMGGYTGNGSADGPFIYCGFRPKFIIYKRTDAVQSWGMLDTSRSPNNVSDKFLLANLSDAEYTGAILDMLSNGFKVRESGTQTNASGGTYIYMAFAENPFQYANAR